MILHFRTGALRRLLSPFCQPCLLNSLPVPCNLSHPWFLHSTPDFSHVLSFPVHILVHYSPLWSHRHTSLLQRHGWSSSFSFSYFKLYSQTSCILLIYIYHKNHFVTSFYFPLCSIDIPNPTAQCHYPCSVLCASHLQFFICSLGSTRSFPYNLLF